MSINRLISSITSIANEQLYPFPKGMSAVLRVSIGSRSLNFGTTTHEGKKYIVLFPPEEISGIKMLVIGR